MKSNIVEEPALVLNKVDTSNSISWHRPLRRNPFICRIRMELFKPVFVMVRETFTMAKE